MSDSDKYHFGPREKRHAHRRRRRHLRRPLDKKTTRLSSERGRDDMDISDSAIDTFLSRLKAERRKRHNERSQVTVRNADATILGKNDEGRDHETLASKDDLFLQGIAAYKSADYEDAIIIFKKILRMDPECKTALLMLAASFFQNSMPQEAIEVYKRLKQLDPDNPSVYDNLGHIYCSQGNFEAAGNEWKQLIDKEPQRTDVSQRIDRLGGDVPKSRRKDQTDDIRTKLIEDGIQCYQKQNYELAIRAFKLAARIVPEASTYRLLGNVYFRSHKINEAAVAFERAASLDAKNILAFENLGQIYTQQGAIDRAIETWERILKIDPDRSDIVRKIDQVIRITSN